MKVISSTNTKAVSRLMLDDEEDMQKIEGLVSNIIAEVRKRGDAALLEFTEKFDGVKLKPSQLLVTRQEIKEAYSLVGKKEITALKKAQENLKAMCKRQLNEEFMFEVEKGVKIGEIIRPIENIGVYIPGGKYPYPSTVIMNLVPAKIAGCKNVIMCTPPNKDGKIPASILVAADLCKANLIIKAGGAQAIAAMAFGTKSVPNVDKIVGPGNIYVATAKKQVFGKVGIDSIAGPSEVAILARRGNPAFIAAELLAQAEHDEMAKVILVTTSEELTKNVNIEIEKQIVSLSTRSVIEESIKRNGTIVLAENWQDAIDVINELAPEHLFIPGETEQILQNIKFAGSIFIGEYSPVAAGDYCSGTNHTLPTNRTARFSSGLSVRDFVVTSYVQEISKEGLANLGTYIKTLADFEGLPAHKNSIEQRLPGEGRNAKRKR